jgi:hypothetical protein
MNVFAPDELFRLDSFQHAELFSGSSQAAEALALRPEYRRTVLCPGIRGDVAEGAHIIGGTEIAYLCGNLYHLVPPARLARAWISSAASGTGAASRK